MDEEIDEDALAAMLADDEDFDQKENSKNPSQSLSFADQADRLTPEQLIELTCSLADAPAKSSEKPTTCRVSDKDMAELFGSKKSRFRFFLN